MTARRAAYAALTTAHYVVSAAATRLDRLADRLQGHACRVSPYDRGGLPVEPAVAVNTTGRPEHITPPPTRSGFPLAG